MDMNPRFKKVLSIFALLASTLLTSCIVLEEGKLSENKVEVQILSSASHSAVIEWKGGRDSQNFTISVYTDSACTDEYQRYELSISTEGKNRFSIPYLTTGQTYYAVVSNDAGESSAPLEIILEDIAPKQSVISQNFDNLYWGYDFIHSAHGVVPNSKRIDASEYNFSALINNSRITESETEHGGSLSSFSALYEAMKLSDWKSNYCYIYPGYVKLGAASTSGTLTTPKFEKIGTKTDPITISFDAYTYADANGVASLKLTIKDGNNNEVWSKSQTISKPGTTPSWDHIELKVRDIEGKDIIVTNDCKLEIKTSSPGMQVMLDNLQIVRVLQIPAGCIYGFITDKDTAEPIEGVAVSDGFSVVTTNDEGMYMIENPHKDWYYVFYSLPAEYQVSVNNKKNGQPNFFLRRKDGQQEYNFSLRKLEGGKENRFALFSFADPQVSSKKSLNRMLTEAAPGILKHAKELSVSTPCYGITLGDVVSTSTAGSNSVGYMDEMRAAFDYRNVGLPVFQVMGNHDCNWFSKQQPLVPDEYNSHYNIKAQREFEEVFGPINYSFNRGDVHVVGMRDIVYDHDYTTVDYKSGFLKEQYEWLVQDLKLVPKDKMVVLCVHIQLYGAVSKSTAPTEGEAGRYVKEVHELLSEFKEAHILSGHTHIQRNFEHNCSNTKWENRNKYRNYNVMEHNMGTVCGAWWASNSCGDGTPNGFGVFIAEGNTFVDWYYMGYARGMNTRVQQLRVYRGDAITGDKAEDNKNGAEGYYKFNYDSDVILANVFNADSKWKIQVYEDGVHTGDMEPVAAYAPSISFSNNSLTGNGEFSSPYMISRSKYKKDPSVDMWIAGYHLGVLDRYTPDNPKTEDKDEEEITHGTYVTCYHLFKYKLKNKDADIKVVAIDRFGNEYETTKFYDYKDNSIIKKP